MKKGLLFTLFIFVILGLYFFTPVRGYLSQDGFGALQAWIQSQGIFAPLVFGLIYVVATVFALPGSILTLGGGLLFGAWWGTLINWLSASLGAMISFLIARYLGQGTVAKILKKQQKLRGLNDKIGKNGFYSVLILRLVPLFPFNALNFGLGLTQVSFRDYALATMIGMLPGTFVYTSLGSAGRSFSLSDPSTWLQVQVWGPFVLVILLSLLPKMLKRKSK
ncbi:MAG: TVP38/TMEM64 family protein [Deltaproteobacteria bacterium]|nr:TVP38/TMEM64 family protein [Deltaproteobacteria bacterium]